MCGIVGILRFDATEEVDEARLKRMRDVLRHRGPDAEGLWIDGQVGFGHRRLSIVDVAGGAQPLANEDDSVWITYNGEVYNHPELRPALERRGHRYRTRSDTETVVHLYEDEGERCVERLRGMFAFGLWDRTRGRLLLARDRLGIKPLYYAVTGQELVFASEIKAILAVLPGLPAFNVDVLPEFLANRYVAGDETFFRGIEKLPPGHTLTWSRDDGLSCRRYWTLPPPQDRCSVSFREAADDLRERLEAVVQSHLMSDVPLGVFLSGGLDSSALAAMMAPRVTGALRTFSVGFAEREANELGYAELVARRLGAIHRDIVLAPGEFMRALPDLVWHEDEPIAHPSSVPLHFVSRLAQPHVKVVLTGEGSDELFLGYPWYPVTAWNERLGRPYTALAPQAARAAIARSVQHLPRPIRRYAERTFLALDPGPRGLFYENFAVFREALQRDLLEPSVLAASRDPYAEVLRRFGHAPGDTLSRMSRADLETYLVELLMKQDQMSMAASIESRVPFLDHELVEHVVSLPSRYKVRGWQTKAVLRAAVRDLVPPEILTRRKMGFPVPIGRWFAGRFAPMVDEFVLSARARARGLFRLSTLTRLAEEHRAGRAEHGARLWSLVNLEIWQRVFLDGEDRDAITRTIERQCVCSG